MKKEQIYLTDITLHVRKGHQTTNFSKIAVRGRMYSPLPKDYKKSIDSKNGEFEISVTLPDDLEKRWSNDEVEIMVPEAGLPIYAGRDIVEYLEKMDEKKRRQLIHNSRTWHVE